MACFNNASADASEIVNNSQTNQAFLFEVKAGDNLWNIIKNKLKTGNSAITNDQLIYQTNGIKDEIKQNNEDTLRDLGFSSGRISLLKIGDRLDLGKYFENGPKPDCSDSDGGYNPFDKGHVSALDFEKGYVDTEDICIGDSVMEAVCDKNNYAYNGDTFKCPLGCKDGVCLKCDLANTCVDESYLNCFDFEDSASCGSNKDCLWIPDNYWLSGHCEPFNQDKYKQINPEVRQGNGCIDSDGGINYYEKGKTSGNHEDSCFKDKNWASGVSYDQNGLYEMYCGDQGVGIQTLVKEYSCSKGCEDGACIK